ncbi:hypothetical protein ACS0TY_026477 [Phlomoides rotata]
MDKASIIKDAIEYIKSLQEEEGRIKLEMILHQNWIKKINHPQYSLLLCTRNQEWTCTILYHPLLLFRSYRLILAIELLQLSVSSMGEKTIVVSLTCSKRKDAMVKLCAMFESLNLKIITTNITAFSGKLHKTVFLEVCPPLPLSSTRHNHIYSLFGIKIKSRSIIFFNL